MDGMRPRYLPELVLLVAVIASAVASIYARHESRKLFTELQSLNTERDQLEMDWGRLQIEQSTWSSHARVEKLAREQMGMIDAPVDQTKVLMP